MWVSVVWMLLKTAAIAGALWYVTRSVSRFGSRRALFVVLLAALLLRTGWAVVVAPQPTGDAAWYHARAMSMVHGEGYSIDGRPTARLAPGYPFALAAVYRLTGPHVVAGQFLNLLLSILGIVLTWQIGRILFDDDVGLTAAVVLAVWPGQIPYAAVLLSEPFFGVVFLGGFLLSLGLAAGRRPLRGALAAGTAFGIAALTRPVTLFFVALTGIIAWLRGARATRAIAVTMAACVAAAILVVAWGLRNQSVFGVFVPLTNSGGIALWEGNRPGATGLPRDANGGPFPEMQDEVERDRLAGLAAKAFIRENPRVVARLIVERLYRTYETDQEVAASSVENGRPLPGWMGSAFTRLCTTYFNVVMLLFCGFLFLPVVRRGSVPGTSWLLVVMPVVYFAGLQALFIAQYRYNYPAIPFIALAAAVVLCRWRRPANPLAASVTL